MSYRSTLVVAVTKELYEKCLVLGNIPSLINDSERLDTEYTIFWQHESINWYEGDTDVEELESWLQWLWEEQDPMAEFDSFGAIRIGLEIGDYATWGSPYDHGLAVQWDVVSPFNTNNGDQ